VDEDRLHKALESVYPLLTPGSVNSLVGTGTVTGRTAQMRWFVCESATGAIPDSGIQIPVTEINKYPVPVPAVRIRNFLQDPDP
jgi:hypothetical protein